MVSKQIGRLPPDIEDWHDLDDSVIEKYQLLLARMLAAQNALDDYVKSDEFKPDASFN
jgi:hypothetical protein